VQRQWHQANLKPFAIALFLLNLPIVGYGDKIPNELATKLVQKFDDCLCKDAAFTACLGLKQKSCEKHMQVVLNGCDFSPLWKEIRRLDHDRSNEDSLDAESRKYGECVNNRFKRQFSVDSTVFERCLKHRFERHVESVGTYVRSSRP
jgi:hypothetical protein